MTHAARLVAGAILLVPWSAAFQSLPPSGHGLTPGMDPARLGLIRPGLSAFVEEGSIAGAVTLVARHGTVASLEGVGYQDLEMRRPMRTDTIFQVMSMTKPVTAIAVLMLMEEEKLSLDDPVEKYLPELAGIGMKDGRHGVKADGTAKPSREITIRDLLAHTSGLSDAADKYRDFSIRPSIPLRRLVAASARQPLEFDPGTRWQYSPLGFDTLGRIIEVVAGDAYDELLQAHVFEPLGMKDTFFFPPADKHDRIASAYCRRNCALTPMGPDTLGGATLIYRKGARNALPDRGLFSTAEDLFVLYQTMLNGGTHNSKRILSPETVDLMTTVQTGEFEVFGSSGFGYGLGWTVNRSPLGSRMSRFTSEATFSHAGALGTYGWIDPNTGIVGVFLVQRFPYDTQERDGFMASLAPRFFTDEHSWRAHDASKESLQTRGDAVCARRALLRRYVAGRGGSMRYVGRRDFLKHTGIGLAAALAGGGCATHRRAQASRIMAGKIPDVVPGTLPLTWADAAMIRNAAALHPFDLQGRMNVAVNALSTCVDPNLGYLAYCTVMWDTQPAHMFHGVGDFADDLARPTDSLWMIRTATNNRSNDEVVQRIAHNMMDAVDQGIAWNPPEPPYGKGGGRWAHLPEVTRTVFGLVSYYRATDDRRALEIVRSIVHRHFEIAQKNDRYLWFPDFNYQQVGREVLPMRVVGGAKVDVNDPQSGAGDMGGNWPAAFMGMLLLPAMRYYDETKDSVAAELGTKFSRLVVEQMPYFTKRFSKRLPSAVVTSHMPGAPIVEVEMTAAKELRVRQPGWAAEAETRVLVDGTERKPRRNWYLPGVRPPRHWNTRPYRIPGQGYAEDRTYWTGRVRDALAGERCDRDAASGRDLPSLSWPRPDRRDSTSCLHES